MPESTTPDSRTPPRALVVSGRSPLLRLTDFGFTYRGAETPALQSVDLVLRPGDAVAVLGPQGAGTSTLARAAAGLLGEHGQNTGVCEVAEDRVGMLGDDPEAQLTGLTSSVEDEAALPGRLLGLPLTDCLERAEASLQALGIAALAQRQLTTLSGGERQLTALAGLLTLRPSVLVLDQPSQALDAGARRRLARSLRAFRDAGGAVLLTGHQHDDLTADCDRVLFLDQGRPATDAKDEHSAPGRVADQPGQGEPAQFDQAEPAPPDQGEPGQPDQAPGRPDQRPQDELRLDAARLDRHGIWDARRAPSRPAPQPAPTTQPAPARHPEAASNPAPEPSRDAAASRSTGVQLHVQGLSITRGDRPVLQDLGLELRAGEVTALLGANGSGKSTLLGALAGLLPVAPGAQITGPRGVELAGTPAHVRAAHLAWVGQDPGDQLSASTVRAELLRAAPLGPGGRRLRRADRQRARAQRELAVDQVLQTAGLTNHAQEHPYDLVPAQRKDCVIASALLLGPAVLLLDEPTLGRDAAGMDRLSTLVRGFTAAGGAVLVATHDQRWAAEISEHQLRLGGADSPSQ